MQAQLEVNIPDKFKVLFEPHRYKIFYGGRGGGKSVNICRALAIMAYATPLRILCCREYQSSISESVMTLLADQIHALGLDPWFSVNKTEIVSHCGSRFIFKGLHFHPQEIKSLEGIDRCFIEEAQSVSRESWEVLRPTIRKEGSEIWASFNVKSTKDPVYADFVENTPDNCVAVKVLYSDNPYLPKTLDEERLAMLKTDPEAYQNVWLGEPRYLSNAVIFKDKFEVINFETPDNVRFFHGLDFGFADDPTAGIRCYVLDDCLFIDREAWGLHIELDDMRDWLVENIPTFATWPVKADSSRPETISKLRRNSSKIDERGVPVIVSGINVKGAAKWKGCVEDRIAYLKSFKKIYVHETNCPHTALEMELYKYKTDSITGEILPVAIDKHNHCVDGLSYSLDQHILAKTSIKDLIRAYQVETVSDERRDAAVSLDQSINHKTSLGKRRAGAWVQ